MHIKSFSVLNGFEPCISIGQEISLLILAIDCDLLAFMALIAISSTLGLQVRHKSKAGEAKCCKEKITSPPNEWRNIPFIFWEKISNSGKGRFIQFDEICDFICKEFKKRLYGQFCGIV